MPKFRVVLPKASAQFQQADILTRRAAWANMVNMTYFRQTLSAAEAKLHFAESLRAAEQGEVVVITRYGRPVAALVNFEELEHMDRQRASLVTDGLGQLAGRWDDAEEFSTVLDQIERGQSRTIPELES